MQLKPLLLSSALLLSFPAVAAQNEVTFGIGDLQDYTSPFIGLEYKRYFSDVPAENQPHLISPYLNKINSAYGRYFTTDVYDFYQAGGEWFIDDQWVVNTHFRYVDYSRTATTTYATADIDVGYFLASNWQVGAGSYYQYQESRPFYYNGETYTNDRTISRNRNSIKAFTRYTNVTNGSGWDMSAEVIFTSSLRATLDARYFFNPDVSLNLTYLIEENDEDYLYDEGDIAEITLDYWFSRHFSLQVGAGARIGGDEDGLATVTLTTSYRF